MSVYCPVCDALVAREAGMRRTASEPCLSCQTHAAPDTDAGFLRATASSMEALGLSSGGAANRLRTIANKLQVLEAKARARSWIDNPEGMGR